MNTRFYNLTPIAKTQETCGSVVRDCKCDALPPKMTDKTIQRRDTHGISTIWLPK